MSRIHEALKKAAEERASQLAGSSQQALVDVWEGAGRTAPSKVDLDATLTIAGGNPESQASMRFEHLLRRCSHREWAPDPRMDVFGANGHVERAAEPFRTLRSRLLQIGSTRKLKRLLVTSSVPGEGKTFVAANLARSIICQPNRRVLLIDTDLRMSRLHAILGAPSNPGLAEYLRGALDDEFGIIQSGPDRNLCFVPAGGQVQNPSELICSEKMKHLLDAVTPLFDMVILDSPPVTVVHDPSLIADLCDGVIFVVRAGVVNFEVAQKAVAEFRNKNLVGVVLNGTDPKETQGQYSHFYS